QRPVTPARSPLALHDALPICHGAIHPAANHATADDQEGASHPDAAGEGSVEDGAGDFPHRRVHPYGLYCERRTASPWDAVLWQPDRKSTRLNSSHVKISYAVFCLKK